MRIKKKKKELIKNKLTKMINVKNKNQYIQQKKKKNKPK